MSQTVNYDESADYVVTNDILEFDIDNKIFVGISFNKNIIMLSFYVILLTKYYEQNEIIVGYESLNSGGFDFVYHKDENITYLELLEILTEIICDTPAKNRFNKKGDDSNRSSGTDMLKSQTFNISFVYIEEENSIIKDTAGITLCLFEHKDNSMKCSFKYNSGLFSKNLIRRFVRYYETIISNCMRNPGQNLSDIEIIPDEEIDQLLNRFNETKTGFPDTVTVCELFEEQVKKTPEKIAVMYGNEEITYDELNKKSNQIAGKLRDKHVSRDSIVGIMAERSIEMVIGIFAILKAGGAYLPIDSNYPTERVKFLLEDSETKLLMIQDKFIDKIQDICIEHMNLDRADLYEGDDSNLNNINSVNDLAYVIYTSGSTGKPKGVMIEHISLVNRLNWMQRMYPISEDDVILQKTSFTFDVSVWEIFWWAISGAGVCMIKPGCEKNPREIVKAIEKYGVTTLHFVPSVLNMFIDYIEYKFKLERIKSLRQIFSSGESLNVQQVERLNRLMNESFKAKLCNLYGPTEATIDVTYYDCTRFKSGSTVPIGKPIDNTYIYILSKENKLQPVGVYGELHIAGIGLARGYLNRPELTKEKFITNPFLDGTKMYKTGDLARWTEDGNIEFLGRLDYQVKIRGLRIELGEIEASMCKHQYVKQAVVLVKEDSNGNKYLHGFFAASEALDADEMKKYLTFQIPEYMIPNNFIQLKEFPITPNGKLDRKRLYEMLG